jgi:hypothetical protein
MAKITFERTSWLLFLKYLDAFEQDDAQIARIAQPTAHVLFERPTAGTHGLHLLMQAAPLRCRP